MLEDFIKKVNASLSENDIEGAVSQLESLFTMADSELLADVVLISARHRKLRSDVRKGLLTYEQETVANAQVLDGLISLLKEVKSQPAQFVQYATVSTNMGMAEQQQNVRMSGDQRDAVMQRMARVKMLGLKANLLWVSDSPLLMEREVALITSLGITVFAAGNSQQAIQLMTQHDIDLVVSDIKRGQDPVAGITFLNELVNNNNLRPFIFYVGHFEPAKGTPPYAFGITNWPNELLHLIMDVLERK